MKGKKCIKSLILCIISLLFCVLSLNGDANAVSSFIDSYGLYSGPMRDYPDTSCGLSSFHDGIDEYESMTACSIYSFLIQTGNVSIDGNNITISSKVNLVAVIGSENGQDWLHLDRMDIKGLSIKTTSNQSYVVTPTSSSYQYYNTKWRGNDPLGNVNAWHRTLTVIFNATGKIPDGAVGKIGAIRALFGTDATYQQSSQSTAMFYGGSHRFYFEGTDTQPIINFSNSGSDIGQQAIVDALSIMQAQNTVINRNIEGISNKIDQQNQQDQQDRDNIQNQSDNADDSANSSAQSAENTGTTLMQAFSSFVTALTSAQASNCVIDFNVMQGRLNGGPVDLCQLSLPQPFQVLASLSLILFCVPLSIVVTKKVISLFRSFQG